MPKQFYRTTRNKQIAGVCSGVAEVYGMKPDTVRLLYVLAHFFALPMFAVYLFQWLVYPVDE